MLLEINFSQRKEKTLNIRREGMSKEKHQKSNMKDLTEIKNSIDQKAHRF